MDPLAGGTESALMAPEVDIVEERTTIIDEILTPTFIALAASVAAATATRR